MFVFLLVVYIFMLKFPTQLFPENFYCPKLEIDAFFTIKKYNLNFSST